MNLNLCVVKCSHNGAFSINETSMLQKEVTQTFPGYFFIQLCDEQTWIGRQILVLCIIASAPSQPTVERTVANFMLCK